MGWLPAIDGQEGGRGIDGLEGRRGSEEDLGWEKEGLVNRSEEDGRKAWVLPFNRLPKGFLRFLDEPPDPPSTPVPSATLILLRQGDTGLEVLLLERTPRSGFIPGAWVFPGGRVDPEDGDPELIPFIEGLTEKGARETLTMESGLPPALAYWVAAARETFEETGVLISPGVAYKDSEEMARARAGLLGGEQPFLEILRDLGLKLNLRALQYHGYWLTPACEPRRYETRFFMTEVPSDVPVTPHKKEMVADRWLTPVEAITRNQEGTLPLVLPTLFTLQELLPFRTPQEAMGELGRRPIPKRLPVPERVEGGVLFRLTEEFR